MRVAPPWRDAVLSDGGTQPFHLPVRLTTETLKIPVYGSRYVDIVAYSDKRTT